jgi:hypothetical protein
MNEGCPVLFVVFVVFVPLAAAFISMGFSQMLYNRLLR